MDNLDKVQTIISKEGRRLEAQDALYRIVVCVLFLLSIGGAWGVRAFLLHLESGPTAVDIYDEAAVLDEASLRAQLERAHFPEPTRIAVLTLADVPTHNVNEAALRYARDNADAHLIDANNRNKWESGTVLFVVAPTQRLTGIYWGEDRDPGERNGNNALDSMKPYFRDGQWNEGIAQGVEHMSQNYPRQTLKMVTWSITLAAGIKALWGAYVLIRAYVCIRRDKREIEQRWESIRHNQRMTERVFYSVPTDTFYGSWVQLCFEQYQEQFNLLKMLAKEVAEIEGAEKFSVLLQKEMTEALDMMRSQDQVDDMIINAATFFNLGRGWESVWEGEIGPIMEDFENLTTLAHEVIKETHSMKTHVRSLTRIGGASQDPQGKDWKKEAYERATDVLEWVDSLTVRIISLRQEIARDTVQPDNALRELDTIAQETRKRANSLIDASLRADTSRYGQERLEQWRELRYRPAQNTPANGLQGKYTLEDRIITYNPASTIRPNPSAEYISSKIASYNSGVNRYNGYLVYRPLAYLNFQYRETHNWSPNDNVTSGSYGVSGGSFSGGGVSGSF